MNKSVSASAIRALLKFIEGHTQPWSIKNYGIGSAFPIDIYIHSMLCPLAVKHDTVYVILS